MNDQEKTRMKRDVEAVLFTMGQAVDRETLMQALDIDEASFDGLMSELAGSYEAEDRGIRLIRLENAYQLCTKKECYDTLIKVASEPRRPVLTEVMMEVLSIISYKQPVTRGEIERIRGVSSDYSVNRLVEYGLIEECGRQESPGRPILFRTTEEFLRKFGISSPSELPPISPELLKTLQDLTGGEDGQMVFGFAEDDGVSEVTL